MLLLSCDKIHCKLFFVGETVNIYLSPTLRKCSKNSVNEADQNLQRIVWRSHLNNDFTACVPYLARSHSVKATGFRRERTFSKCRQSSWLWLLTKAPIAQVSLSRLELYGTLLNFEKPVEFVGNSVEACKSSGKIDWFRFEGDRCRWIVDTSFVVEWATMASVGCNNVRVDLGDQFRGARLCNSEQFIVAGHQSSESWPKSTGRYKRSFVDDLSNIQELITCTERCI